MRPRRPPNLSLSLSISGHQLWTEYSRRHSMVFILSIHIKWKKYCHCFILFKSYQIEVKEAGVFLVTQREETRTNSAVINGLIVESTYQVSVVGYARKTLLNGNYSTFITAGTCTSKEMWFSATEINSTYLYILKTAAKGQHYKPQTM